MQTLTLDEVMMVSGGDRGDATAGGAVGGAGAGAAFAIARGAGLGLRAGIGLGLAGIVGGAIIGGGIGFIAYQVGK